MSSHRKRRGRGERIAGGPGYVSWSHLHTFGFSASLLQEHLRHKREIEKGVKFRAILFFFFPAGRNDLTVHGLTNLM